MIKFLFVIGSALLISGDAFAQQQKQEEKGDKNEMNVDYPDQTQETDLVEKGTWQFETAFLFNRYSDEPNSYIGEGLLRYGVFKNIELRVLVEDGYGRDRYIIKTVQSTYPLAVSAKVVLIKDKKSLPDITLISYLKLPFTSQSGDKRSYWSPVFLAAFQNKFGEKWKLEYNAGIQQEAYSPDWAWLANAAIHYKITDALEIFTEYYAQYQNKEEPEHNLGGGLSYQLGRNVEVYVSGGSTIFNMEANHYLNGGIAFRIPR